MTATIPYLQAQFTAFNALCFGGKLPPIDIRLGRSRQRLGCFHQTCYRDAHGVMHLRECHIRVSTAFDLAEDTLQDVLIHEMIHYYIACSGLRDTSSHGTLFRRMMDTINLRYDRHITTRHATAACELPADTRRRSHIVGVIHATDGGTYVIVPARTRIFSIHNALSHSPRVKALAWFHSTSAFFNTYPRSRTATSYAIDAGTLSTHLTDATPLVCDGTCIRPRPHRLEDTKKAAPAM